MTRGGAGTGEPLVGRDAELAALTELVAARPLVSVVGPGGVGKTRLATAVLAALPGELGDTATVRLEGLRDADVLTAEVAAALGVPRTGGEALRALTDWLADRPTTLLLDNAEHLVDAVARLAVELVEAAPSARVLVTSREPLLVPGEAVFALAPLPVPGDAERVDVDREPAVRLFLDRVAARDRGFDAATADRAAVVEICRRVDGLPLALELAAARAATLGLAAVAVAATSGSQRGVAGRHSSLRAVFDWSHDLLDDDERALLHQLAVFAGGFDRAALTTVATGDDALDVLARLVDKSLVVRDGERFRLLETVRGFAHDHLVAEGGAQAAARRHADHFLGLGAQVGAGVTAGPERPWLELLGDDLDNLRVALRHGLGGTGGLDPVAALAVAAGLPMFWWAHGRHQEGFTTLRAGLDACPDAPPGLRAASLFGMAFLWAHDTDDWAAVTPYLDEALALVDADDPVAGYASCLRGEAHAWAGEHDDALVLTRRGEAVLARVEDPWGQAFAVWNVGFALQRAGDLAGARDRYARMAEIQQAHGSRLELMIAWNSLGEIAELTGDHATALHRYELGLQMRRDLGARRLGFVHGSLPGSLLAVARCALAVGDRDRARAAATEALDAARAMRDATTAAAARAVLATSAPAPARACLVREGSAWRVGFGDQTAHVADVKGLHHLQRLVAAPGRDLAATELAALESGVPHVESDAGPVLDDTALAHYRRRLADLAEAADGADRAGDPDAARRVDDERGALLAELSRATGLGGRARRAGSTAERARLNVTRTLRDAVARLRAEGCPRLADHLDTSLVTGHRCSYRPTVPVSWTTTG